MAKVSVIITTYKRAALVSQAIASVLAQTYTDYEIIVVNDGSPDNTKEVLASLEDKITTIHQENQGICIARNTGIKAAKGKYIAFLDDDDLWVSNKLEQQISCLESHPNIGMIYSDAFVFDENGVRKDTYNQNTPAHSYESSWTLFLRNPIIPSTVILQKECLDNVGGFDPTILVCEDFDLWLRIAKKYPIFFLNEPLAYYRRTSNSLSRNTELMSVYNLKVKKKAFDNDPSLQKLPQFVLERHFYLLYFHVAYFYINAHQYEKARSFLAQYLQLGIVRDGLNIGYSWLWMMSFPALTPSTSDFSPLASTDEQYSTL